LIKTTLQACVEPSRANSIPRSPLGRTVAARTSRARVPERDEWVVAAKPLSGPGAAEIETVTAGVAYGDLGREEGRLEVRVQRYDLG
jgi:hypothetical protein